MEAPYKLKVYFNHDIHRQIHFSLWNDRENRRKEPFRYFRQKLKFDFLSHKFPDELINLDSAIFDLNHSQITKNGNSRELLHLGLA